MGEGPRLTPTEPTSGADPVIEWHMVQCRMMLDFRERPPDMIVPEELRELQKIFSEYLDNRYGEGNVDLCYITHEGMYREDIDEAPEGWGLSNEEMWELIPGETEGEKRAYIEDKMRGIDPEEL